jgi:hypothetical protein
VLTTTNLTPTIATPQNGSARLELANQLFRQFHTRCFWHSPRDLVITEELIPFVVKGLRTHGGRRGFLLAEKLQPKGATRRDSDRELLECR